MAGYFPKKNPCNCSCLITSSVGIVPHFLTLIFNEHFRTRNKNVLDKSLLQHLMCPQGIHTFVWLLVSGFTCIGVLTTNSLPYTWLNGGKEKQNSKRKFHYSQKIFSVTSKVLFAFASAFVVAVVAFSDLCRKVEKTNQAVNKCSEMWTCGKFCGQETGRLHLRPIHTKRQRRINRAGFAFGISMVLGQRNVTSVVPGVKYGRAHIQRWCRWRPKRWKRLVWMGLKHVERCVHNKNDKFLIWRQHWMPFCRVVSFFVDCDRLVRNCI